MSWIWEQKDWPDYRYTSEAFTQRVNDFHLKSERLYGRVETLPSADQTDALVDLMLSEAIKTSAIEGEELDRESVRSSILNLIGADATASLARDDKALGAASLMVDVRKHWDQPLSHELLGQWQSMVVVDQPMSRIMKGAYRNDPSPMQIVSGAIGRHKVHYEAPPSDQIPDHMNRFLDWYNTSSPVNGTNPLPGPIRAGIAHVWFENIHPFGDGNGRVGRAISDHALSQSLGYPTLACLATAIERNRKVYYQELENVGRGNLNINPWLDFFIGAVDQAQEIAKQEVDFVLDKTRFYHKFQGELNERQAKAVGRVFAEGTRGFEGGLTTKKYQSITKCSRATAFRDLSELVEKGVLVQLPGGGRSTRYALGKVEATMPHGWNRDNSIPHGESEMELVPNTFSEKEIEDLEYTISEIFEFTDPTDDLTVLKALESADISTIEAALERLTDMDIQYDALMADIAPSQWRVVSMDRDAFKERHDQSSFSARDQLKENLFKAVGKLLDSEVWEACPGSRYTGDVVHIDQNYLYLQLSENSVSAHALNQMSQDQLEKLLDQITVGDYLEVNEIGEAEKAERPITTEHDRGFTR